MEEYISKKIMADKVRSTRIINSEFIAQMIEDEDNKTYIISLPCKIGDKLYDIEMNRIEERTVTSISVNIDALKCDIYVHTESISSLPWNIFVDSQFGTTIFLTRKEAEEALVKRNR